MTFYRKNAVFDALKKEFYFPDDLTEENYLDELSKLDERSRLQSQTMLGLADVDEGREMPEDIDGQELVVSSMRVLLDKNGEPLVGVKVERNLLADLETNRLPKSESDIVLSNGRNDEDFININTARQLWSRGNGNVDVFDDSVRRGQEAVENGDTPFNFAPLIDVADLISSDMEYEASQKESADGQIRDLQGMTAFTFKSELYRDENDDLSVRYDKIRNGSPEYQHTYPESNAIRTGIHQYQDVLDNLNNKSLQKSGPELG